MADTLSIGRITQLGPETTPGTAVPATKLLSDLLITVDPSFSVTEIRGAGHRYDAVVAPTGQEHVTGKVSGALGYNSFIYLAGMQFGSVAPTTPANASLLPGGVSTNGAINARLWSWNVPLIGAIPPKTFTLEQGDANNSEQVPFLMMTDMGLDFTRAAVTPSGNTLGQAINSSALGAFGGMTGGLSSIPIVPVLPVHWAVYMDASSGAIGTTKLLRAFHAAFSWGSVYGPFFPINPSVYSYAGVADNPGMTQSALLELMKDAAGEALWTQARNGQPRWIRFLATSVVTNAGVTNGYYADNYTTFSVTGGPTGGTFTVSYKGVTSAAISSTSTAAALQTILTAMSSIGAGNVVCQGGPLPGTPIQVIMSAALANDNSVFTLGTNSLTGGASPTPVFTQTLIPYSITIDFAGSVKQPGPQADNSNLRTRQWDFLVVEDPNWGTAPGTAFKISGVNTMPNF